MLPELFVQFKILSALAKAEPALLPALPAFQIVIAICPMAAKLKANVKHHFKLTTQENI